MEDQPLLHPGQFDDLVLEYLFGHGHRESFPKRNPHMKRLIHNRISVMNSTMTQPFQTGNLCFKVLALNNEMFKGVGCFIANIPKRIGFVTVSKAGNYLVH
jgi:hypothetical protein